MLKTRFNHVILMISFEDLELDILQHNNKDHGKENQFQQHFAITFRPVTKKRHGFGNRRTISVRLTMLAPRDTQSCWKPTAIPHPDLRSCRDSQKDFGRIQGSD